MLGDTTMDALLMVAHVVPLVALSCKARGCTERLADAALFAGRGPLDRRETWAFLCLLEDRAFSRLQLLTDGRESISPTKVLAKSSLCHRDLLLLPECDLAESFVATRPFV